MPSRPELSRRAPLVQEVSRGSFYCLSYTAVLVYFLPCESVPLIVTVRLFPSAETTARREPALDGMNVRNSRTYGSARLTLFEH